MYLTLFIVKHNVEFSGTDHQAILSFSCRKIKVNRRNMSNRQLVGLRLHRLVGFFSFILFCVDLLCFIPQFDLLSIVLFKRRGAEGAEVRRVFLFIFLCQFIYYSDNTIPQYLDVKVDDQTQMLSTQSKIC